MLDWSGFDKKPTEKQQKLYKQWKIYLRDSKLSKGEIERRARLFAEQGKKPF